jgi:hypothetical protein
MSNTWLTTNYKTSAIHGVSTDLGVFFNNPTENMLEDTLEDPLSLFSDDEDIQRDLHKVLC